MDWRESISAREAEVLAAIRGHQSNAQIAAQLHLSVRTVESHVASLLRKAGVPDRRSLAALAEESGGGSGLPVFPTSFVGRESERAMVAEALEQSRLVNLVGVGGMGKTRLAVEVAAGLDRDAVFVDLVPVRAGGVGQAVAQALGVVERPPGTPADAVVDHLRAPGALLVLDNCEHVIAEVGELVARILRACPRVTILATSRERLAVPGERLVQVPPLGEEAGRLFLDRARATDPELVAEPAAVERLCAGLDGMPLAIELVAARAAFLGVDGARAALDDLLRLISGGRGPDQRHHSLQEVIGWSLELLDDEERVLFRRLGVFVGGFDLDAAAAVSPELSVGAVADLVGRLADRSLVVHRRVGTTTRWSLLETVRAVALHELNATGEDLGPRYVRWAADTAARLEHRVRSTEAQQPLPSTGGSAAGDFDAVADDLRNALTQATLHDATRRHSTGGPAASEFDAADDLRNALTQAAPDVATRRPSTGGERLDDRTPGGPTDPAVYQLAKSLAWLSFWRGLVVAARDLYRTAAELDPANAADDLTTAAAVALATADGETGFRLLMEAAARAEAVGDKSVEATSVAAAVVAATRFSMSFTEPIPHERLVGLLAEASALAQPTDPRSAAVLATARAWTAGGTRLDPDLDLSRAAVAAARRAGDDALVLGALDALGTALANAGRLRQAHRLSDERLRLAAIASRFEPAVVAELVDLFHVASTSALAAGDLPAAAAIAEQASRHDAAGTRSAVSEPATRRESVGTHPAQVSERDSVGTQATRPDSVGTDLAQAARRESVSSHPAQASRRWSVGAHPAIIAPRMIRLHGLTGDFDGALAQADVLWDGWLSSGVVSELSSLRGDWPSSAVAIVALVHGVRGDGPRFEEWRSRALRVAHVDDAADSLALAAPAAFVDARVAVHTGRYDDAPRLVAAALAGFLEKWWMPYAHAAGAELAVVAGLPDADERLAQAGPAAKENDWAAACLARATARRTGDLELMGESVAQWERIAARFERAVTLLLIPERADEGAAELAALRVPRVQ
ncbi:ATP-binding protein [Kribbella endophytica]